MPHEHVTYDIALPMDCYLRVSVILEPHGRATRFTVRIAELAASGVLRAVCMRFVGESFFAKKSARAWRVSLENLAALVAAEAPPRDAASAQPATIAQGALAGLARRSLGPQESPSA